jgi:hypothetical protein
MMENLRSYVMHQQNQYGPLSKGKVDLTKTTHGSFIHFMGVFDGEYIDYNEDEAWKSYRRLERDKESEDTPQGPGPPSIFNEQQ